MSLINNEDEIFNLILNTVQIESLLSENNYQNSSDADFIQFETNLSNLSKLFVSQSKSQQILLTAPIFRLCSRSINKFPHLIIGSPKRNQSILKIISSSVSLFAQLEIDEENQLEFLATFAIWSYKLKELIDEKKVSESELEYLIKISVESFIKIINNTSIILINNLSEDKKNDIHSIFSSLLLFILNISSDFFYLHNSKILVQNSINLLHQLYKIFPDESFWFDHLPGVCSNLYVISINDKKSSKKTYYDMITFLINIFTITLSDENSRHKDYLIYLNLNQDKNKDKINNDNNNSSNIFSNFLSKQSLIKENIELNNINEEKFEEYNKWRIDFLQKISVVLTNIAENCFSTCSIENKKELLQLYFTFLSKCKKFIGLNLFSEFITLSFLLLMTYEKNFNTLIEEYYSNFLKNLLKENSKFYYDLISLLTSKFILLINKLTNSLDSTLNSSNAIVNSLLKCYGYFIILKNETLSSLIELNYNSFFNFFIQLFKIDVTSMRKSLLLEEKSFNLPINSILLLKLLHENSNKKIQIPSIQLSYYQFPYQYLPYQRNITYDLNDFSSNSYLISELLAVIFGNELKNSTKFISELKSKNKKMMKILYYCLFSKLYNENDSDEREKRIEEYETKRSPVNKMNNLSSEAISILNLIKITELRKVQFCHIDFIEKEIKKKDQVNNCSYVKCKKENSKLRCSRCKLVFYCCQDHQVKDWKTHKLVCKPSSNPNKEESFEENKEKLYDIKLTENVDSIFSLSKVLHTQSTLIFNLSENKKGEFVLKTDLLYSLFENKMKISNSNNIDEDSFQLHTEDKIIYKKNEVKSLIDIFNFFTVQFEFYIALIYSSQLLDRFSLRKEKFRLLLPYYSFYISYMCQIFGEICILLPQKYLTLLCRDSLYTLLELATLEEDDVVKVSAHSTLLKLGGVLGFSNFSSFLMGNFDYLIDKICGILRSSIEKIKEQKVINNNLNEEMYEPSDYFNISGNLKSLCFNDPYWEKFFIHYDRSYRCHKVISFLFRECKINISEIRESYDSFLNDDSIRFDQNVNKNSSDALTPIIYLRDMIQDSLSHMDASQLFTNQVQEQVVSRTILSVCEVLKVLVIAFEIPSTSIASNYVPSHWKYLPKSCFVYKDIEKIIDATSTNDQSSSDFEVSFNSINKFLNNILVIKNIPTEKDEIEEISSDKKIEEDIEDEKEDEAPSSTLPSSLSLLFSISQRALYILSLPILSTQVSSLQTIQSILLRVSAEKQFFPQLLYKVWTSLSKRIIDLTNKVIQHKILSSHLMFRTNSVTKRRVISTEKLEFSPDTNRNFLKLSNKLDDTSQNFIGSMLTSKQTSYSLSVKETRSNPEKLSDDYHLFSYVLDTVSLMILLDPSFLSHKIDEELMPCVVKILSVNYVLSLNEKNLDNEINSFFVLKKWKLSFLQLISVVFSLPDIYNIHQKYIQSVMFYILSFTRPNEEREVVSLAHSLLSQLRKFDPSFSLLLADYCSEGSTRSHHLKNILDVSSLKLTSDSSSPPIMNWKISQKTKEILQGNNIIEDNKSEFPNSYNEMLNIWTKV